MRKTYIKPKTSIVLLSGEKVMIVNNDDLVIPVAGSGQTTTPEESDSKMYDFDEGDDNWDCSWKD